MKRKDYTRETNAGKKPGISESRRNLLKGLAVLPFAGSFSIISSAARILSKDQDYLTEEAKASLKKLKGTLPKGKLGKYEISRLVLGCNPMGGWSHSRDLPYVGQLSKHWHTETKMKETWAIAEQAGINFCNLVEFQYKTFNEYKKETGSKMLNVCQCSIGADFVCLGMYDFQVVDDVNTTIDILGNLGKRERPWYS